MLRKLLSLSVLELKKSRDASDTLHYCVQYAIYKVVYLSDTCSYLTHVVFTLSAIFSSIRNALVPGT